MTEFEKIILGALWVAALTYMRATNLARRSSMRGIDYWSDARWDDILCLEIVLGASAALEGAAPDFIDGPINPVIHRSGMPSISNDLTPAELSAVSDGDEIRLQRAAVEVGRRRHFATKIDDELEALERFVSRPVSRRSYPIVCEAIERLIGAHKLANGG